MLCASRMCLHYRNCWLDKKKKLPFAEIPPGELSEQNELERRVEELAEDLWENPRKTQRQREGAGCCTGWKPEFETPGQTEFTLINSYVPTCASARLKTLLYCGKTCSLRYSDILVIQVWRVAAQMTCCKTVWWISNNREEVFRKYYSIPDISLQVIVQSQSHKTSETSPTPQ